MMKKSIKNGIRIHPSPFLSLFASQLILMLMGMFISVKMGLATLPIVTVLGVIALGRCSSRSTDWKRGRNLMAGLILIWGLYCLFEIGNSNHVQEAWNIAIPQYFFYPLLCAFLVPLTIRNYKGIEALLLIWSVFVLIATLKGYWQKITASTNGNSIFFMYWEGTAPTSSGPASAISPAFPMRLTMESTQPWPPPHSACLPSSSVKSG